MVRLLDKVPYAVLIPITAFMLLAPFYPLPHVLEKLIMLKQGALHRPMDIFDLGYHLAPLAVLLVKLWVTRRAGRER